MEPWQHRYYNPHFIKEKSWGCKKQNELSQISGRTRVWTYVWMHSSCFSPLTDRECTLGEVVVKRPQGLKPEEGEIGLSYFKVERGEVLEGETKLISLLWENFSIWKEKGKKKVFFKWSLGGNWGNAKQDSFSTLGKNIMVSCIPGTAVKKQCFPN